MAEGKKAKLSLDLTDEQLRALKSLMEATGGQVKFARRLTPYSFVRSMASFSSTVRRQPYRAGSPAWSLQTPTPKATVRKNFSAYGGARCPTRRFLKTFRYMLRASRDTRDCLSP